MRRDRFVGMFLLFLISVTSIAVADEPVFSGPQEGELLPPFPVIGVLDEEGKEFNWVQAADDKPIFLLFIHQVTRPSIGLTRSLTRYAATRKDDGLVTAVVFLSDDMTAMQARVKQMRRALPEDVHIGISPDKQEGPGAYGLNRNVAMTILVAKEKKVTANFALVQPSLQADGVRVLKAVVKTLGSGETPSIAELVLAQLPEENLRKPLMKLFNPEAPDRDVKKLIAQVDDQLRGNPRMSRGLLGMLGQMNLGAEGGKLEPELEAAIRRWRTGGRRPMPRGNSARSEKLGLLLRAVINKNASDEEVAKAGQALEAHVKENPADQAEVGRIAKTIVSSGRLGNYGTKKAQELLEGWAKKYGSARPANPRRQE